jgi:glutathione-specific gamma-glutamylcyclotransferase
MADLFVFGYGSLMWRTGFDYDEAQLATLTGYRRCFCIYSVHHRGTPQRPGLVLGLDRGGACRGMVFRVPERRARDTLQYLRAREQVNGVYREALVPVTLDGGGASLRAVAYLAERAHPSYTGRLTIGQQARLIRAARGLSGGNLEYLISTLDHLAQFGLRERELERVLVAAGSVFARGSRGPELTARTTGLARLSQNDRVVAPTMPAGARRRFLYRQS